MLARRIENYFHQHHLQQFFMALTTFPTHILHFKAGEMVRWLKLISSILNDYSVDNLCNVLLLISIAGKLLTHNETFGVVELDSRNMI